MSIDSLLMILPAPHSISCAISPNMCGDKISRGFCAALKFSSDSCVSKAASSSAAYIMAEDS